MEISDGVILNREHNVRNSGSVELVRTHYIFEVCVVQQRWLQNQSNALTNLKIQQQCQFVEVRIQTQYGVMFGYITENDL